MSEMAEPNLADRDMVGHCEESLGSTSQGKQVVITKPIKKTWQDSFNDLSTEIHLNIMAQMHRDPVSQVCLGLVSQYWHRVFHCVHDPGYARSDGQESKSKYRAIAPDLRCQVSADEQHMLYGSREYWYMLDAWDIVWGKPLIDLLWGEKWLWKGTKLCEDCMKFKPESAYSSFYWERQMLVKHADKVNEAPVEDVERYKNACRRCRAKYILITFEGTEEYCDPCALPEDRTSLGLKDKESPFVELSWEERKEALRPMGPVLTRDKYDARLWTYLTWTEVFEDLDI